MRILKGRVLGCGRILTFEPPLLTDCRTCRMPCHPNITIHPAPARHRVPTSTHHPSSSCPISSSCLRLQSSRVQSFMPPHTSSAMYFRTFTPIRLQRTSRPPSLSTSARLQCAYIHTSIPLHVPRPVACLQSSRALCIHASSSLHACLKSFIPPHLHVPPPSARLQSSIPLCSTSARLQRASRAAFLHTSTSLDP